jgi:hypothetical protein
LTNDHLLPENRFPRIDARHPDHLSPVIHQLLRQVPLGPKYAFPVIVKPGIANLEARPIAGTVSPTLPGLRIFC